MVMSGLMALPCGASAPPSSDAPPAKVKTPPPLKWSRLPVTDYLCTRFGPDWQLGKGAYPDAVKGRTFSKPFTLALPPGHALAFRVEAKGKSGEVTYGTSGWPAEAALDAKTGKFTWSVAGKAGETFDVTFEARSAGGEVLTWTMMVAIATEAEQLAFRAGSGGKTWPDCGERPGEMTFEEVDLDRDGHLDVYVSTAWTEADDAHGHRFSRHDAVFRRPKAGQPDGAVKIDWDLNDAGSPLLGEAVLERLVDGTPVVRVDHHACNGGSPVEYFRFEKARAISAGRFDPDEDGDELDMGFDVVAEKDAAGAITALSVKSRGQTKRYTWKRGAFRR
jgi:hypothetical protein